MRIPLLLIVIASVLLAGCATPQEDEDGDGLPKALEEQFGTDPTVADTDGDGLTDGQEVTDYSASGVDPLQPDTDGDGLDDYEELILYGTNPAQIDTDRDGIDDRREVADLGSWSCEEESQRIPQCTLQEGLDPLDPDTDDDRWPDGAEMNYWRNITSSRNELIAYLTTKNVDGDAWQDGLDADPLHDVWVRFEVPTLDLQRSFSTAGSANLTMELSLAGRSRTVTLGNGSEGRHRVNVSWRVNVDDGPALHQNKRVGSAIAVVHVDADGNTTNLRIDGNRTSIIPETYPIGDLSVTSRGPLTSDGIDADVTYRFLTCRPRC